MCYPTKECQLIVNYIITKTSEYNLKQEETEQISLTIKRIQSLLYFIQIESIKHFGKIMFKDDFYAWPNGPAIPEVYHLYLENTIGENSIIEIPKEKINNDTLKIIDSVLESTNNIKTIDLLRYSRTFNRFWERVYNPYDQNHNQIIHKNILFNYCKRIRNNTIVTKIKKLKTR